MLEDLNETGFIYRRSKSKRFYPTRLAASLSSSAFSQSDATTFPSSSAALVSGASKPYTTSATDASSSSAQPKGFIIVETNFRVYAYTRNLLQIAVLNLFVQFRARFPDMVVGEITRAKMKGALEKGITADQVRSLQLGLLRQGRARSSSLTARFDSLRRPRSPPDHQLPQRARPPADAHQGPSPAPSSSPARATHARALDAEPLLPRWSSLNARTRCCR